MGQYPSQPISKITTSTEKTVSVYGFSSVTFDIAGTASSADVTFSIIAGSGIKRAVNPTKISDDLDIVSTANVGGIYNFDTTGITSVVISVQNISGGNVDVFMTGVD